MLIEVNKYIGKTAKVVETIMPDRLGKIQLDDSNEIFTALCEDNSSCIIDAEVKVLDIIADIVYVELVHKNLIHMLFTYDNILLSKDVIERDFPDVRFYKYDALSDVIFTLDAIGFPTLKEAEGHTQAGLVWKVTEENIRDLNKYMLSSKRYIQVKSQTVASRMVYMYILRDPIIKDNVEEING